MYATLRGSAPLKVMNVFKWCQNATMLYLNCVHIASI